MGNWVLRRLGDLGGFGKFGEQIEKVFINPALHPFKPCSEVTTSLNYGHKIICMFQERVPKIAATYPASTSIKVFTHGNQCFKADKLQHYNYGRSGNIKRYGQPDPPCYDLKNATAPVAIFYSDYDRLCSPRVS